MKYEVNAVVTPTQVATKKTTYCFHLKSVMEKVDKCTTIEEVRELLNPVEEAIKKVLKRSFRFSIDNSSYGNTPRISYAIIDDGIINEYRDGVLYVIVLSFYNIDCVTVQMKEIEDSTSDSSDTNKSEE